MNELLVRYPWPNEKDVPPHGSLSTSLVPANDREPATNMIMLAVGGSTNANWRITGLLCGFHNLAATTVGVYEAFKVI